MIEKDEIEDLRKEFKKINLKDKEEVAKWFADHPYLSRSDNALIMQRNVKWVMNLERFGGREVKSKKMPITRVINEVPYLPDDWRTKEWLEEALKKYSTLAIARAAGLSRSTVNEIIKKLGVKKKKGFDVTKPVHKCNNYAWCYEHYVEKKYSLEKCSKIAGVARTTFTNWLSRHGIPQRGCSQKRAIKLWVNRLMYKLENQDVVNKTRIRENHLHVRFKNFAWESYYFAPREKRDTYSFEIDRSMSDLENVPAAQLEYEGGLDEMAYPGHIIIPKSKFKKASFMEQRIAIHSMAWAICRRGWIPMDYPEYVIDHDWRKILTPVHDHFYRKKYRTFGFKKSAGWRIMEHYFPFEDLLEGIKSGKLVSRTLTKIAGMKRRKLNTHNLIRELVRHKFHNKPKVRMIDPRMYVKIFKSLRAKGKVLDIHPGHGARLLACAALGLTYVAPKSEIVQYAIDKGIIDLTNLKFEWYDGQDVDFALNDNDLYERKLGDSKEYISSAKNLLHFVNKKNEIEARKLGTPKAKIPVQSFPNQKPDYLYLF